jgi:hypothetical protein
MGKNNKINSNNPLINYSKKMDPVKNKEVKMKNL